MEIILTKDVAKLGRKGEVRTVKNGYFMNFLYPRGFAKIASPKLLKWAEQMQANVVKEKEQVKEQAVDVKKQLEGSTIKLEAKTTDKDTLYGKITEKDLVEALKEQVKIKLDKKQIVLAEPIKTVGKHKFTVNLTDDVSVETEIEIVPLEEK